MPLAHMAGSSTDILQRGMHSAANYRRLAGCMYSVSGIVQDCRKRGQEELAETGAGILLDDSAMMLCMVVYSATHIAVHAPEAIDRSHSTAPAPDFDLDRTTGCHHLHRS